MAAGPAAGEKKELFVFRSFLPLSASLSSWILLPPAASHFELPDVKKSHDSRECVYLTTCDLNIYMCVCVCVW